MKLKYLMVVLSLLTPVSVHAESFTYKGKVISSLMSVKVIDCGKYKIYLNHEAFPHKYENHIPSKFRVKEFYGSATTIFKQATIQPGNVVIPNPNDLTELKPLYLNDRTYLASSAACNENRLIVSYWSGGNCSQCEAFVSFDVLEFKLLNPKKVNYSHFKSML